ncbi:MAG: hypothetical protein Q9216_005784 [Gyalolechia sp. 2 TL-2023]
MMIKIPENIKASQVDPAEDGIRVTCEEHCRLAKGSANREGANDGHKSFYRWNWLAARNEGPDFSTESLTFCTQRKWGFCLVDGCPVSGEATKELIERISFIRHTHYGGFWQFTSDLASKDSAYTSLALGAHTDTTYFSDPAGLQTFHLLSHTDGDGGASLLVDGFQAAEILRRESPAEYETLCQVKIRGHASGNEKVKFLTDLAYPVLVTAEARPGKSAMRQVRWNNDDRAAMVARDPDEIARWYAAAKKWVEILRRSESEYWEQLRPGRPLSESQLHSLRSLIIWCDNAYRI